MPEPRWVPGGSPSGSRVSPALWVPRVGPQVPLRAPGPTNHRAGPQVSPARRRNHLLRIPTWVLVTLPIEEVDFAYTQQMAGRRSHVPGPTPGG